MQDPKLNPIYRPIQEEKRAHNEHEPPEHNRKQRRAKKSKEKRATKKAASAALLARIDALTRLCRVQADELAMTRRNLRGALAARRALEEGFCTEADLPIVIGRADEAAREASAPQPDDGRVNVVFKHRSLGPSYTYPEDLEK